MGSEVCTTTPVPDRDRITRAVSEILAALDLDEGQEGIVETPRRVADMYAEVFSGLQEDPVAILGAGFVETFDEMVVARDISFFSMCEHHLLPFFGVAHIGYIPDERIVGISKLARVTDILARRPQMQERLTTQIADTIVQGIQPKGVGVVVEATHLCMAMRGVKKPGSKIVTSINRGIFRTDPRTRAEFLSATRPD